MTAIERSVFIQFSHVTNVISFLYTAISIADGSSYSKSIVEANHFIPNTSAISIANRSTYHCYANISTNNRDT